MEPLTPREELKDSLQSNLRLHSRPLTRSLENLLKTRETDENKQEVLEDSMADSMDSRMSTVGDGMRMHVARRLKLPLKDQSVQMKLKTPDGWEREEKTLDIPAQSTRGVERDKKSKS